MTTELDVPRTKSLLIRLTPRILEDLRELGYRRRSNMATVVRGLILDVLHDEGINPQREEL